MSRRLQAARRLKRLLKKQERRLPVALNLVSMIDVFTTLVFFLLLTSTTVETIETPPDLTLPNSVARDTPVDAPVVLITTHEIQLQGQAVMSLADAAGSGPILEPLKAVLAQLQEAPNGAHGEVNIVADRDTPYALLRKVMATCGDARYARISLSVDRHGQMVAP